MRVFKKWEQIILKFVRKHQRCWTAKTTLRKKKNAGGIPFSDFKSTVIETDDTDSKTESQTNETE